MSENASDRWRYALENLTVTLKEIQLNIGAK